VSDGTAAGTRIAADIDAGSSPSTPKHLTYVDGELVFTGTTEETGRELWNIDVDFDDFLILSASFSRTVPPGTSGDFDDDGTVGFSDFLVLSANFWKRR
jgi:hypothetical protein